jgi:hypothetical protein
VGFVGHDRHVDQLVSRFGRGWAVGVGSDPNGHFGRRRTSTELGDDRASDENAEREAHRRRSSHQAHAAPPPLVIEQGAIPAAALIAEESIGPVPVVADGLESAELENPVLAPVLVPKHMQMPVASQTPFPKQDDAHSVALHTQPHGIMLHSGVSPEGQIWFAQAGGQVPPELELMAVEPATLEMLELTELTLTSVVTVVTLALTSDTTVLTLTLAFETLTLVTPAAPLPSVDPVDAAPPSPGPPQSPVFTSHVVSIFVHVPFEQVDSASQTTPVHCVSSWIGKRS